jgi:cell division protein FtsB
MSLVLLVVLGAVGYNLFFVCQLKQQEYEEKQADLDHVLDDIHRCEIRNKQLEAYVKHLKTDSGVEEIAREKLGLVSPGEMAFVVVPPPPPRSSSADEIPPLRRPEPGVFQQFLHKALIR